jgi:hypothetical protein
MQDLGYQKTNNLCNKWCFVHANLENIIYRHEIEFVTMATETKQPERGHIAMARQRALARQPGSLNFFFLLS